MIKNTLKTGAKVFFFSLFLASPSFAGTIYTSRNGNLTVHYGNSCSTIKPSGWYRFRGDITGTLTSLDCSNLGGDIASHKFVDTTGKERCHGRMTQYWGGRDGSLTVWEVYGAVSGYRCSVTGKKFEVKMDDGKKV